MLERTLDGIAGQRGGQESLENKVMAIRTDVGDDTQEVNPLQTLF